jgi:hypothetical protein
MVKTATFLKISPENLMNMNWFSTKYNSFFSGYKKHTAPKFVLDTNQNNFNNFFDAKTTLKGLPTWIDGRVWSS